MDQPPSTVAHRQSLLHSHLTELWRASYDYLLVLAPDCLLYSRYLLAPGYHLGHGWLLGPDYHLGHGCFLDPWRTLSLVQLLSL